MLTESVERLLLNAIDSTNTTAKTRIQDGTASRLLVVAREQTRGRGRGENRWQSPPGGVFLSLGFPVDPEGGLEWYGPQAGLLTRAWLNRRFGVTVGLKWPNDLLVEGRKLGGFLLELIQNPAGQPHLILGLGINVNTTPALTEPHWFDPIALTDLLGLLEEEPVVVAQELGEYLLEGLRVAPPREELLAQTRAALVTLGQEVTVLHPTGTPLHGIALDIDNRFALLVDQGGSVTTVEAGDCFHTGDA